MTSGLQRRTAGEKLWSLDEAARKLGLEREMFFEALCRAGYAYRYTGIATGKPLAYMHWVRAGLFRNNPVIMVTEEGMARLSTELLPS